MIEVVTLGVSALVFSLGLSWSASGSVLSKLANQALAVLGISLGCHAVATALEEARAISIPHSGLTASQETLAAMALALAVFVIASQVEKSRRKLR